MVSCESDVRLWTALGSGPLLARAGVSITKGSLSEARQVAARASTVLSPRQSPSPATHETGTGGAALPHPSMAQSLGGNTPDNPSSLPPPLPSPPAEVEMDLPGTPPLPSSLPVVTSTSSQLYVMHAGDDQEELGAVDLPATVGGEGVFS
jgi:hypothetical protein